MTVSVRRLTRSQIFHSCSSRPRSVLPAPSEQVSPEPVVETLKAETSLSSLFTTKQTYETETHPDEPDHTQPERRVQDNRKVEVLLAPQRLLVRVGVALVFQPVDVLDGDGQNRVAQHPNRNQPGTERLVLVIHGGFLDDLLNDELRDGTLDGLLELIVEVALVPLCIFDDGLVRVLGLLR